MEFKAYKPSFYKNTRNGFGVITLPLYGRVAEPTCWRCGEGSDNLQRQRT